MCDPATLATLALVGSGVSAVGTIQSGQAAKQAGELQAELFRREADRDREIAALEASRIESEGKALAARQRVLLAGQGRDISTGSALLIQTDLAEEVEFQKQLAEAGGDTQAALAETKSVLALAEGRSTATSSLFRAGSTLLTGVSEVDPKSLKEIFG